MYFPNKFGYYPHKHKKKKKNSMLRNRRERRSANVLNLLKSKKNSLRKRTRKMKRKPVNLDQRRFRNRIADVGIAMKKDITLMNAPETN